MHLPVRLLVLDVDGTLLRRSAHSIAPRVAEALQAAVRAGITVAIATGRRTDFTTPLIEGLDLPESMPLITSNGAVVRTLGGELYERQELGLEVTRGLCQLMRPFGSLVITFDRTDKPQLVLEEMPQAEEIIGPWIEANRKDILLAKPIEGCLVDGELPIQAMAAGHCEPMRQAAAALAKSPLASLCSCVKTEYIVRDLAILDLLPPGLSKGSALERLAARLGIDRKAVMAVGDNWNDELMLEWAGQPVLMGNAPTELKAKAKMQGWIQVPENEHDGAAVAIERAIDSLKRA